MAYHAHHEFQFTPLREGRHPAARRTRRSMYFNSRPSARGDMVCPEIIICAKHFNSRPSARGDPYYNAQQTAMPISIHAPPRGATWRNDNTYCRFGISIHAPPRGATGASSIVRGLASYFNSRPSARGDGAAEAAEQERRDFNSRPSARGDKNKAPDRKGKTIFQFTPLREGRPSEECADSVI